MILARNHKYGRQTYDDGDDDDDNSYSYGAGSSGANYGYTYDEGMYLFIWGHVIKWVSWVMKKNIYLF